MSAGPLVEQRAALAVHSVSIIRMEGVRDAFQLDSLCAGINLIHGPNGIGKSRTAEALQALIWSDSLSGRTEIVGGLRVGDDEWRVDLDMGRTHHQRNGVPESRAMLDRQLSVHRDRYVLTLQDLLRLDNRDFAKEILQEAAGGFDLTRVHGEKGNQSGSVRRRTTRLLNDLRDADLEVSRLRQHDRELQRRERSLIEIRTNHNAAIAASERVRTLEHAQEYADALARLKEAETARAAFADPLGRMSGEEYDQALAYARQLRELSEKRLQVVSEIYRYTRELGETGFSDNAAPTSLVPALRNRLALLSRCRTELQQARRIVANKSVLLASSRARISEHITDAQLVTLDSGGLQKLSDLTRQWRDAEAELHIQETLSTWLGKIESETDVGNLRRGTDLLGEYMQLESVDQAAMPPLVRWVLLLAAALIALEAVLLAGYVSIGFSSLVVLAAPVVWVAMRTVSPLTARFDHIQQDYSRLGLVPPEEWNADQASVTLLKLQQDIAIATVDQEKIHRWHDLADKRQLAGKKREGLDAQRRELLAMYGAIPDDLDHESLRAFSTALEGWRAAADGLSEAEIAVQTSTRETEELLRAINDDLLKHGEPVAQDISQATASIESLGGRIATAEQLRASLDHVRRDLDDEIEPRIEALNQQVADHYQTLAVDLGDETRLRALCDQVDACAQAQRLLEESMIVAKTARARLESTPEYADMPREWIERDLDRARQEAGQRENLQKELSSIEAELEHARRQMQLEEALARQSAASDTLEQNRQDEYDAVAASSVFELVQSRNHDVNRPEVFRVAEELFSSFTVGAYGLELDDGPDPSFLARDTSTGRSLGLNELSSGTRVQLLLAIRLAFIESMEHGPQLPVILDETLGNTDDVRATVIIEAAIKIAQRGRQVFYFTAQKDEIGKWLSCLDDHPDAPERYVCDLAMIRGQARAGADSGFEWNPAIFARLDIPEETDHESLYGLLAIPPIDLWAERAEGADLWYLIRDVPALVELRNRGIRTWGQYKTLHRHQHLDGIWTEHMHACAVARAHIIEAVCRDWRLGRPRPLTKESLRTCGLITDRFWDEVIHCAETQCWDGTSLINALRRREVSNFLTATTDRLEEWFQEHGYITGVDPLSDQMIRARVISVANTSVEQGIIAPEEIDELLMYMMGEPVLA